MTQANSIVNIFVKGLTRILCIVDDSELAKVPAQGPLIVVSNHINFIEVPILYTHLQPRRLTGFAKAETWNNPLMGKLFDMWDAIPLNRGEADASAFRSAMEALEQKKILAITPEGTRSGHGQLQQGHPGIIHLAYLSKAPILPLVYYGSECLKKNLYRLRRTDFHIRVGRTFQIVFPNGKVTHDVRMTILNEIMYQLAQLLPLENRGYYTDLSKLTTQYLSFT